MSKTSIYLATIAVLTALNAWLFFFDGPQKATGNSRLYFENFPNDQVNKVTLRLEEDTLDLTLGEGGENWILNDQYKADDSFVRTLLSVLQRIETVRTIGQWEGAFLGEVLLQFENGKSNEFQFATNPTQTKSYLIQNQNATEVVVPGYRDNVVSIFTLHPDQWRDRLIFDGSWRTIQKVEIQHGAGKSAKIQFEDKFFLVNGVAPADSSAVVDYLNQFQYLEANEMISKGRFPVFDSLSQTKPVFTIIIDDIKLDQVFALSIFPKLEGQAYHLLAIDGQMLVMDAKRVDLLIPPEGRF